MKVLPNVASAVLLLTSSFLVGCGTHPGPDTTSPPAMADIYRKLIFAMGDPSLSVIRHYEAATMIAASTENEALPYLIQALDDQRVFDPEYSPPSGAPDDPLVILTVGKRCESMLLYNFLKVTPKSAHSYRVKDWNAWWLQHRSMTLYEIQQSVRDWEKKDEVLHPK